ncbi:Predicted dithiol-disulfide isomerase, DsbA family [Anoxynatronum buryatiense]|uniref:Predicted dithiol-disulfide isomerase, DsbA family n=1 Tax=Anoxynatronum buryatiense TaxID=489973 RepID=A0AA45WZ64_9CLOT|nr:Predicted dithiol-disulfide isomerase, DsbA family [Anoxynatronum buryatiense]
MEQHYPLDVTWVPFELHPATPEEGILLTDRFGAEDFNMRLEELKSRGARWNLTYHGLERMANSRIALLAELYATHQQCGEAFRTAVSHAYFEEGLNIGRQEVLLRIGEKAGLDRQQLETYLQRAGNDLLLPAQQLAKQWSVSAVPTFVVANEHKIVGSDQDQALRTAIEKAMKAQ